MISGLSSSHHYSTVGGKTCALHDDRRPFLKCFIPSVLFAPFIHDSWGHQSEAYATSSGELPSGLRLSEWLILSTTLVPLMAHFVAWWRWGAASEGYQSLRLEVHLPLFTYSVCIKPSRLDFYTYGSSYSLYQYIICISHSVMRYYTAAIHKINAPLLLDCVRYCRPFIYRVTQLSFMY